MSSEHMFYLYTSGLLEFRLRIGTNVSRCKQRFKMLMHFIFMVSFSVATTF